MNRAFDYNGTVVSQSKPVQKLRTVQKVVHIYSGDRDSTQYPTNGDFIVFLPRTYDNVVGIRVKGAEFPPISSFYTHAYGSTAAVFTSDNALVTTGIYSIFLDIDNLNKSDETGPVATATQTSTCHDGTTFCNRTSTYKKLVVQSGQDKRTSYIENTFAKFQLPLISTEPILYNESSSMQNESYFQPPLSRLDRLHLHLRTHTQKGGVYANGITGVPGYIYSSGGTAGAGIEFGLSLELDILENSFDDFSSLETRINDRDSSFWQTR